MALDAPPDGRYGQALFERIVVRGFREVTQRPKENAAAHALGAVLPGQFATPVSGQGERDSPATNDLPITMRLAEPPEPGELVRSA